MLEMNVRRISKINTIQYLLIARYFMRPMLGMEGNE